MARRPPDAVLPWRHWSDTTLDLVITAVVTTGTLVPVLLPRPHGAAVAAALLASVPVFWRRRCTIPAGFVVAAATTWLSAENDLPPLPLGALVLTYTLAAQPSPARRLAGVAVGGVLLLVSLILPGEELIDSGYIGMFFATAYALGTGGRARRARIGVLEERARRLEEERAAAAARERTRIARDMHDVVTHSVGLMVVQAESGALLVDRSPERAVEAFDAIADRGRDAIAQLRFVLDALRSDDPPPARRAQPGLPAVPDLVAAARHAGVEVALVTEGEAREPRSEVGVAAYRIVQEALTNVLRHARAEHAAVTVRWEEDRLSVEVRDDGRGPAPAGGGSGHGLVGMRERVAACGGTLRIGPESGRRGFVVHATFPI
ncbi:histidine kinase [Actinomadura sp. NPDC049382]|jgi:signal transduction histidine kinase